MGKSHRVHSIEATEVLMDPNFNCRGEIPLVEAYDIADSIKKQGLLHAIVIAPRTQAKAKIDGKKYLIIAGNRRFVAMHHILGWKKIPSVIRADITDEATALTMNLAENASRKDLNILQEARAVERIRYALQHDGKPCGMQDVAESLGQSFGWIQVRTYLLALPESVQMQCAAGIIRQSNIRKLYTVLNREGPEAVKAVAKVLQAAKERNIRLDVTVNKQDTKRAVHRTPTEIFNLIEHLLKVINEGMATYALSWAAGELSLEEFNSHLEDFCIFAGIQYTPHTYGDALEKFRLKMASEEKAASAKKLTPPEVAH